MNKLFLFALLSLPSVASADCFDFAQTGALTCSVTGDLWRGAEEINETYTSSARVGLEQEGPGFKLSFKVVSESDSVAIIKMGVSEGYYVQAFELPLHKGVSYGHGCSYKMKSLDTDSTLNFICRLGKGD